eukprot:6983634-Lingulodinium_polyedra.AAC.1
MWTARAKLLPRNGRHPCGRAASSPPPSSATEARAPTECSWPRQARAWSCGAPARTTRSAALTD